MDEMSVNTCCVFVFLCFVLKELKECAGRVFVDSQPEFCLPEVCMARRSFSLGRVTGPVVRMLFASINSNRVFMIHNMLLLCNY